MITSLILKKERNKVRTLPKNKHLEKAPNFDIVLAKYFVVLAIIDNKRLDPISESLSYEDFGNES